MTRRALEPDSESSFSPVACDGEGLRVIARRDGCRPSNISTWAEHGGPLPPHLAAHVLSCDDCAEKVRRISEVNVGLTLLCTQSSPPDLLARANARALRFLRKAARASAAAQRLLRMRPNLTPYQRAYIYLSRASVGAAAAMMVLVMRTGIFNGIEQTTHLGQQLAKRHWERHIDPNGEWFGPHSMT